MRTLSECHSSFQAKIHVIAGLASKSPEMIFSDLWLPYSETCSAMDQSATIPEFVSCYAKALRLDAAATITEVNKIVSFN